jgi:20S proteasome subunit beta 6
LTLDEADHLLHDAFVSAAERHVHVGDNLHFKIVTAKGVQDKSIALRKD